VSAVSADGVGKRYGSTWALRHCNLSVPEGRVVGLVGTNGAGKTTLLQLLVGLLEPTEGGVSVFGAPPAGAPESLARVGFLAQDAPLYPTLSVEDHLRMGRVLNAGWDDALARQRAHGLGLGLRSKAGSLSGGQRAQLALTLAVSKRPQLLVLDEPMASLDPLARRDFLAQLMELVADCALTVILSSHSLADVERVCDHLVVVDQGRVAIAGDVHELLGAHVVLTGPSGLARSLPPGVDPVEVRDSPRQCLVVARVSAPVFDPRWSIAPIGLEDLVLAYLSGTRADGAVQLTAVAS
jgi:ABC-2 type transport system ATP-binding protein